MARQLCHPWQYSWVIFGLSLLNLVTEGGLKSTVPVVYVALRDSFHWSAAVTSGVFSLAGLVGGLSAPVLGRLLDRWGPQYLFPVGGLLILLGWCGSSLVTDLWPLLLFYSVIATVGENVLPRSPPRPPCCRGSPAPEAACSGWRTLGTHWVPYCSCPWHSGSSPLSGGGRPSASWGWCFFS
jgi:MFS family permease